MASVSVISGELLSQETRVAAKAARDKNLFMSLSGQSIQEERVSFN